ncbi:MAG TPA: peptidylprolyl isomerase [Quisquiliibacterium sp.]|nr:MAG: molecular chaperone SurA [Burkholderiaceae bacterium]HOA92227.1 peptidylprolyl isomerase [Quisquiliibacterium sp.]
MSLPHRLTCAFVAMLLTAAVHAQAPSAPRELDRVIAVVNTDIITANELAMRQRTVEQQLRRQRIDLPPPDVLRRQVLERLIMDRALAQAARDQGLRVDDAQLDRALARIAEQNRLTPSQLRTQIERDGMNYVRFREDIRDEILVSRLREREVDAKVVISEADVDAWLADQGTAEPSAVEYNLSQILLRIPEGASPEQIERQRLRAEEVVRQAQRGAEFARLAAAFSDAPDAMSGGAIGFRPADRLPQLYVDAVATLKPGEVTPPLRSPNGFHILKLVDRRASVPGKIGSEPVVQTRARHILIRPSELVPEGEVMRRLRDLRDRVRGGADFAELARQYSSDGSAGRGGDLGWVYPGDTVPDFERAMAALQPGQVSDPVRTEFGVHLIQVLERRTDSASPERVRQAARQALRERRIEEALQDWLRQVRDRAYVEYRDQ